VRKYFLSRGFLIVLGLTLACLPATATPWPHSDIAPDPAVKFGVLSNGMRYAIMRNQTPAGAVSVRLSMAVGSTYEAPAERGFSHFVEHMAFRGSKNFPDGELNRSLERLGLRFGADTNAATGQYTTTYRFDLPGADAKSLAQALAITRDIASDVSFEPKAVETEAGVVMSEAAMRMGPARRSDIAELLFQLNDPRAVAMPGGQADIVQQPTASDLKRFYRAYYRPDRAILTVVGDVDPGQMEAQIVDKFQDWKGVDADGSDPVFHVPLQRALEARVHVETETPSQVVLAWIRPPFSHPLDRAGWRRLHIGSAVLQIVNRRLSALAASAERPFMTPAAWERDVPHGAELFAMQGNFDGANWQEALTALARTRLALLRTPVSQAEIDSVVASQKAARERAVLSAGTRSSPGLANALAAAAAQNDISVSPASAQASLEEDLRGFTPEIASQALRDMFDGDPMIFVTGRNRIEETAVLDAYRGVTDAGAVAAAAQSSAWPYTSFGAPGRVVETSKAADLGVTSLTFANHVRLLVRPSKLRANQVLVSVKFGAGRLGFSKSQGTSWMVGGMPETGLGALSVSEMVTALSGKAYRVGFGVQDNAFVLGGETSSQDLETELQVIAAYIKDPGFRTGGFEQFKQQVIGRIRAAASSPAATMGLQSPAIFHGGDARWAIPSVSAVQAAKVEELKALLEPALEEAPIEVVVTGDTTVEQASRMVARTLGALPVRQQRLYRVTPENDTAFPPGADAPVQLPTLLPPTQSVANVTWATHGLYINMKDDAALTLLSAILRERLLDDVRGQGLSYAVSVSQTGSTAFDFGYLSASATMPTGKSQLFYQAVDKIAADIKEGHISADEFERCRTPILQEFRKAKETNEYWAAVLNNGWDEKAKFAQARDFQHLVEGVTPADVAAAARQYLVPARMLRISAGS
jgi:zinc protease